MKTIKHLFVSLLMLVLTVPAWAYDDGFTIPQWTYEATVHADGTINVREAITADFTIESHGLYRFIPRKYKYMGILYDVEIDNIDVPGYEFIDYPNVSENSDDVQDNIVIRAGGIADNVIGRQTYVFTYDIHLPYDRSDTTDYFFHSLMGSDVPVHVDSFAYCIRFDEALPASAARYSHLMMGSFGEVNDQGAVPVSADGKTISGILTDIPPRQAYTMYLRLPEGTLGPTEPPSHSMVILAFVLMLAVALYLLLRILRIHKEEAVPVVSFYPPDGISSAEVGTIIDDSADMSDLTSLVLWFASKGYITIEEIPAKTKTGTKMETKTTLRLTKAAPLPDDAPKYQKSFMKVLFKDDKTTMRMDEMEDLFVPVQAAMNDLKKFFAGDRLLTKLSSLVYGVIAFHVALVFFYASDSFETELSEAKEMIGAFIFCVPLVLMTIINIVLERNHYVSGGRTISRIVTLVAAAASMVLVYEANTDPEYEGQLPVVCMMSLLAIAYAMAYNAPRLISDTPYRLKMIGVLVGLRDFIETAEKNRLKMLVDENPEYFFDILPYAVVFGLSKKWTEHFAGMEMASPEWYVCDDLDSIGHHHIADHLCNDISNSISSSIVVSTHSYDDYSSTGSSGSSGGYSGGGSGGGGVGRW